MPPTAESLQTAEPAEHILRGTDDRAVAFWIVALLPAVFWIAVLAICVSWFDLAAAHATLAAVFVTTALTGVACLFAPR